MFVLPWVVWAYKPPARPAMRNWNKTLRMMAFMILLKRMCDINSTKDTPFLLK